MNSSSACLGNVMTVPPSWKESLAGTEFWAKQCFLGAPCKVEVVYQPSGHSLGGHLPFPLGAFGEAPVSSALCNANAGCVQCEILLFLILRTCRLPGSEDVFLRQLWEFPAIILPLASFTESLLLVQGFLTGFSVHPFNLSRRAWTGLRLSRTHSSPFQHIFPQ